MFRIASDPAATRLAAKALLGAVVALPAAAPPGLAATAQQPASASVVSSQVSTSADRAELRLELAGGRALELALGGGRIRIDGEEIGAYRPGDALDRSWRELLDAAAAAPSTARLVTLLVDWSPPSGQGPGRSLDAALEAALAGAGGSQDPAPAATQADPTDPGGAAPPADSFARRDADVAESRQALGAVDDDDAVGRVDRREIEREIRREIEREVRSDIERELRRELEQELARARRAGDGPFDRASPLQYVGRGLAGIFGTLAIFAVLVGLGFAAVFFGRRYLEGVADTARHATVRSWLVGLAASFLAFPVFILGTIALAISIVGIPLLLVWLPLFPVVLSLALLFGYLAVAHGAGEALAERRFHGGEWFKRANSYYYILTGVGLLLALFIAAHVIEMGGPWLGFIRGILTFLAIVLTWAVFTIGLGAVLISRAGTRPLHTATAGDVDSEPVLEEEQHV